MLRIAIVDDEKEFISKLQEITINFCKTIKLVYEIFTFCCGEDLLSSTISFDIVFLDVKMEEIDGIETAQRLRVRNKQATLLYVTSYGDYITKAMTVHPFAYITKPFDENQVYKVLEELLEYRCSIIDRKKEYFELNINGSCSYIETSDILYFYYEKNRTVRVKFKDETYKIKDSITDIYNTLNHSYFLLPSSNVIINIKHISKIDGKAKKIILKNGEEFFISRRKYKDVLESINHYITNGGI